MFAVDDYLDDITLLSDEEVDAELLWYKLVIDELSRHYRKDPMDAYALAVVLIQMHQGVAN